MDDHRRPAHRPAPLRVPADVLAAWVTRIVSRQRLPYRVLVASLPKAGTNLVRKALDRFPGPVPLRTGLFGATAPPAHPGAPTVPIGVDWPTEADARGVHRRLRWVPRGGVLFGHVPHSTGLTTIVSELDVRVIAVVRDPRAVAVSLIPFVLERPHHFLHHRLSALDPTERLAASIAGLPPDERGLGLLDVGARLAGIAGWRDEAAAIVLRFEDLVGAAGGGSDDRQHAALTALARHVGVAEHHVARVATGLFGGTSTFRRGSVDAWREQFDPEHHDLVRATVGSIAADLGYDLAGP